jgi:putative transcriptional regulator
LIAMPQLNDPNFARTVVLMVEHGDDGSFGLVVNRSLDLEVPSLLDRVGIEWRGQPGTRVGYGGPVMGGSLWLLHEPIDDLPADSGTKLVMPGVVLTVAENVIRRLAQAPPARLRFLLGYAGWGPGQLAGEMMGGSWLHADGDAAILFDTAAEKMWERAVRSIGIEPDLLGSNQGVS